MNVHLTLIGVFIGLLQSPGCPAQRTANTNPLQQLAGNIRFCGQTLMRLNAPRARPGFNAAGMTRAQVQQQQQQAYRQPMMYRRPQPLGVPTGQAVFGLQLAPPYMRRIKRQIQQQRYQEAFVPNLSHLRQNQNLAPIAPQQTYQQQQQVQPGLSPQQRFLAPQPPPSGHHAGIHNLMMALDPPDPPDLPDFAMRTTPSPFMMHRGFARPGPAIPRRPGQPMNNPGAANVNRPGPQMFQPPPPPPPTPRQAFNPPMNPPATGGIMSPQQIRRIASMPMLRGLDNICFCTDSSTCAMIEGNMDGFHFSNHCTSEPPPNIPPSRSAEVCCCMG